MTTFDGGSGEVCQIRRIRTNTPLQALVTLNDPVFLEAAGALANRMVMAGTSAEDHVTEGLRRALIRSIAPAETEPLLRLQHEVAEQLSKHAGDADELIRTTRAALPKDMQPAEFASWIVVANTVLNLDEFLVRN